MHELHLINDLLSDLLKNAEANKVKKITKVIIRLGEFTELNPEIVRHFLKDYSADTAAEGAELVIEPSATRELRLVSYEGD